MKRKESFRAYLSIKQILKGLFFVGMVDFTRQKFGEERFQLNKATAPLLLVRESCYQYGIHASGWDSKLLTGLIDDGFAFMERRSTTLGDDVDDLRRCLNNNFSFPADGNSVCDAAINRVFMQTHGSGIELFTTLYEEALQSQNNSPLNPRRAPASDELSREEFFSLSIREKVDALRLVPEKLSACDIGGRDYLALRTSMGLVFISIPGGRAGHIQPEILSYGDERLNDILHPITAPVTFHTIHFIANHLVGYVTAIEASSGHAELYCIED